MKIGLINYLLSGSLAIAIGFCGYVEGQNRAYKEELQRIRQLKPIIHGRNKLFELISGNYSDLFEKACKENIVDDSDHQKFIESQEKVKKELLKIRELELRITK